jgi:hypothetical protein
MDASTKELHLLLMYLTGWEEELRNKPGEKAYKTWKGYSFEVLNELQDENFIVQFKNTNQPVQITDAGRAAAEKLKQKYMK